jgi:NTP pyrophosphatase (non-canonical NTP hydrolase)
MHVTNDEDRGLYDKYKVERKDGSSEPGGKHEGCQYFVLDLNHDPYSVPALLAYATACRARFPELATDLLNIVTRATLGQQGREGLNDIDEYQGYALRTLASDVAKDRMKVFLNAATGLSSETGEINEIIKKHFFHGHPWNADTQVHMKKELGDLAWYFALMCHAIGVRPSDVLMTNIAKLKARYPAGFSTEKSLNRAEGDI